MFSTIKASAASFVGTNGIESPSTHNGYDNRIALPSGWATDSGLHLSDGVFFRTSGSAPFVFTPGVSFDRISVAYQRRDGSATFSVNVNGGASLGSTSNNGAPPPDIQIDTFNVPTLADSNAVVNIISSGNNAELVGVRVWRSDESEVSIINAGWWSGTTVEHAQSGNYGPLNGIRAFAPDLTVVFLGINDIWWAETTQQAYEDALNDIVDAALDSGSVLLVKPHRISGVAQGTQDTFFSAVDAVGLDRDVPVLSLPDRWGTNEQAGSAGFLDSDNVHLSGSGYGDVAAAVFDLIGPAEASAEPFVDDFNRANSANIGNDWVEKNPAAFAISGNEVVPSTTVPNYWDNVVHRPVGEAFSNGRASVEFRLTNSDIGYPQVIVRAQPGTIASAGNLDCYIAFLESNATAFRIGRQRGSDMYTVLASGTLSESVTTSGRYRVSLESQGTNPVQLVATMERWNAGTSAWVQIGSLSTNDSSGQRLSAAGVVGFGKSVDNFAVYDNFSYEDYDAEPAPSAPVISAATPSGTVGGQTSATIGCTTDKVGGTVYVVVDSSANLAGITAPQVVAGTNANDASPAFDGSSAVSTVNPSVLAELLTAGTAYSYAIVHVHDDGTSNLLTGSFTTAALPVPTIGWVGVGGTFINGATGIVIAGSNFTSVGSSVFISPTDDIDDVDAVSQTITSAGTTSITITTVRGALPLSTPLYLFVRNSDGYSNASGFQVQFRPGSAVIVDTLVDGQNQPRANLSGIRVLVWRLGRVSGPPDQEIENQSTNENGILNCSINVGSLSAGDSVFYVADRNNPPTDYTAGLVVPEYS